VATRLVFIARDTTESDAARAALTESLEVTRAIFDAAVDGIVMIDRKFRVVESNAAIANMLGMVPDREARQDAMAAIHPDDVAAVADAAERLFTSDEIITIRYRAQHTDGHWVKIESRGRGLSNPLGPTTMASSPRAIFHKPLRMKRRLRPASRQRGPCSTRRPTVS